MPPRRPSVGMTSERWIVVEKGSFDSGGKTASAQDDTGKWVALRTTLLVSNGPLALALQGRDQLRCGTANGLGRTGDREAQFHFQAVG